MPQRVMSRHFAEVFVSQYRKTLHGNPSVLCFGMFPLANELLDNKGGGECQDFPSKIFCLTVPKSFAGHPLRVSLISGIEKFYAKRALCHNFSSKILSRSTESLCR